MKILYIDVETTGLDPVKNGIHQIAGIVEINQQVLEEFNFNVKPYPKDKIEDDALAVSNTSRNDLKGYYETEEVINMVAVIIHNYFNVNDKFILCGHNINFDFNFVDNWYKKFGTHGFSKCIERQICTLELAKQQQHKHGYHNNKLITVANHFGYKFKAHDALEDIKATKFIHEKLDTVYYNDLF
jgi:DNA polymerase-3 subunit epsilon